MFFLRFESDGTGYKSDFSQKLCGNGEIFVDVRRLHQSRPFLSPTIADPVRWNLLWHRLMKFFGELIFRPGMQLQIQRTQSGHPIVKHFEHLLGGHPVSGDLKRKIVGILHLFGYTVSQITERNEIGFQHRPNFFRSFPNRFPLGKIATLFQFVVDLVGGDFLAVKFEFKPVHERCLFGLGGDSFAHQLRICHRPFRCV